MSLSSGYLGGVQHLTKMLPAVTGINLDEDLYVTQITRTYNADGSTSATVQVSNVDDLPIDDPTVLYDQAAQMNSINRAAG